MFAWGTVRGRHASADEEGDAEDERDPKRRRKGAKGSRTKARVFAKRQPCPEQTKTAMGTWVEDPTASNKAAATSTTKAHRPRLKRACPVGAEKPSAARIFGEQTLKHDGQWQAKRQTAESERKVKASNAKCNAIHKANGKAEASNAKHDAVDDAIDEAANQARLQKSLLANTKEGVAMSMERTLEKAARVFANVIEQIPAGHSLASLQLSCVGVCGASHLVRTQENCPADEGWECCGHESNRHGRILPCHSHSRLEVLQMEKLWSTSWWGPLAGTNSRTPVGKCACASVVCTACVSVCTGGWKDGARETQCIWLKIPLFVVAC